MLLNTLTYLLEQRVGGGGGLTIKQILRRKTILQIWRGKQ